LININRDETRLKEIQTYKNSYNNLLKTAETILEKDLIQIQLDKLNQEEKQILERNDVII